MERFRQIHGDKEKDPVKDKAIPEKDSKPKPVASGKPVFGRTGIQIKTNSKIGTPASSSGGKLAFSLKHKSKLAAPPVKSGGDDEDDDDGADVGNVSGNGSYAKR